MTGAFCCPSDLNVHIAFRFGQASNVHRPDHLLWACTDIVSRPGLGEGPGYYALTNFFNQANKPR